MLICALCFSLRVTMLALLAVHKNEPDGDWINLFVWEMLSDWIPSIIPFSVLLYFLRKPHDYGQGRYSNQWSNHSNPIDPSPLVPSQMFAAGLSTPTITRDSLRREIVEPNKERYEVL